MGRRRVAAVAGGLPLALVALLVAEAVVATRGEYLAVGDYEIDTTVDPRTGGGDGPPLRLVVLGDSTTAGIGSPTLETSLPVLVAQRVADRLARPVHVQGLGVSGARTVDVRDEQVPLLVDGRADVVLVVIGSNDATHATPWWRFAEQTRGMLEAAHDQSGGAPVVLGGIPLFGSAGALAQPLRSVVDGYADVLRRRQRTAAETTEGAAFVDIASEASPRFRGVPDAMSADGFHPAPVGYGFWADALAPAVAEAVR